MNRKIQYLAGFIVIIAAFVYLALTSFKSSLQYYVTVSELHAQETNYQDKTLKVAGIVSEIAKNENAENSIYNFFVEEGGKSIAVEYKGFVPDTFKNGSQVVVTGKLKPDGHFEANHILAKCASKYEAKIQNEPSS